MDTRESKIESKVCKYAQSKGWLVFKFVSPGNTGVPDRLFLKDGKAVFVEFKAPSKKISDQQNYVINKIRSQNFLVIILDNFEACYEYF